MDVTTIISYLWTIGGIIVVLLWIRYFVRRAAQRRRPRNMAAIARRPTAPPMTRVQAALGVPVAHLPNPYPPYTGTLRINDPLRDNSMGYSWMADNVRRKDDPDGCHFCEESYRLTIVDQPSQAMMYCLALYTNFSDMVYQIEVIILKGTEAGIVFRQTPGYRYYHFYIRRDGTFGLFWCMKGHQTLLADGLSSAINIELNQPNVLAVVANGTTIDLYVNQQHLTRVVDGTYHAGRIGTATSADPHNPSEVAFRNLMLWTLDEADANQAEHGEQ